MIKPFIIPQAQLKVCQVQVDQVSCFQSSLLSKNFITRLTETGTQALVRSGSPNSSLSADDGASVMPICRAIAILDSSNFSFEKEALKFKVDC